MKKRTEYIAITGVFALAMVSLISIILVGNIAGIVEAQQPYYYVVGGEIEVPEPIKEPDYTPFIVGGVAAAALIIGLIVASRIRSSK